MPVAGRLRPDQPRLGRRQPACGRRKFLPPLRNAGRRTRGGATSPQKARRVEVSVAVSFQVHADSTPVTAGPGAGSGARCPWHARWRDSLCCCATALSLASVVLRLWSCRSRSSLSQSCSQRGARDVADGRPDEQVPTRHTHRKTNNQKGTGGRDSETRAEGPEEERRRRRRHVASRCRSRFHFRCMLTPPQSRRGLGRGQVPGVRGTLAGETAYVAAQQRSVSPPSCFVCGHVGLGQV